MYTLLTYIQLVTMEQFVLLEDPIVLKDVLKYVTVLHGVLSVMIPGIILMLVLSVDS